MNSEEVQTGEVWLLYPLQTLLRAGARLPFPTMIRLLRLLGMVGFRVGQIPRDDWLPDGVMAECAHASVLVQWMQEALALCEAGLQEDAPEPPLRRREMANWLGGRFSEQQIREEHRILLDLLGKWQQAARKDRQRQGVPEPEGGAGRGVDR